MGAQGGGTMDQLGTAAQKVGNSPVGKVFGGMYAPIISSAGTLAKGKNPLPGSTVGSVAGYGGSGSPWQPTGTAPDVPTFGSALGANGQLKGPYSMSAAGVDPNANAVDQTTLNNLKTYANGTGPSPWLALQNQNIGAQTQQNVDQATMDSKANTDSALTTAALHGGVTGGGSARIAGAGLMGQANAQQGARLAGSQASNTAAINDEQNKLAVQTQIPGMDLNNAKYTEGINQFNVGQQNAAEAQNTTNALGGMNQDNTNKMGVYGQQLNQYMGNNLSSALASSGGKKKG